MDRSSSGENRLSQIVCSNCEKPRKKKLEKRYPSFRVETRTRHLQTSKQKFYLLDRDIQYTHD